MNQLTAHRGPDQTAVFTSEGISLGHNRLAIIDLSPAANQPIWDSEHRTAIILNGEIYNYRELRAQLAKKYTFVSQSDTEVILYAYKEYGPECLTKLNGMFALAIWDNQTKELFLARDPMGIKPLCYFQDQRGLFFSSEIKALLAAGAPRKVNTQAFSAYFNLLYIPEPQTMFEGIYKLPAGHWLRFKGGQRTIQRYYALNNFFDFTDYVQTVNQVRGLFKDSVRRQLVSDRPVGVFLSGGLDSTAVLGAATEFHGRGIKTFSVSFSDNVEPDKFAADARLAKQTAAYYGSDHQELVIGAGDFSEQINNLVWHLDEPNFNPTAGAMFLLSRLAKQHVAVVLGGDGGDELFGGYPRYYYSRLISAFQRLPSATQQIGRGLLSLVGKKDFAEKLALPPDARRVLAFLLQKQQTVHSVIQPSYADARGLEVDFQQRYFGVSSAGVKTDFEKHFMHIDRQSWLVDESLLRTDRMTMAFGLEARVPILDYRLVELALRIPTAWKFSLWQRPNKFQGKHIWRDAVREYLPEHVLNQPKRGWFTPMAKWVRADLRLLVEDILLSDRLPTEFFNRVGVARMWQDHLSKKYYNLNMLWAIVMWQLWYERFIKSSS